jgi:hypothetical protein
MANITKMLTYNIPDELYSNETTLGKTSTQLYNGPEEIVIWADKETGYVRETWHPDEEPDRPLPLDIKREILRADTDENTIKIALLWGGLEPPKRYEVQVGPADQPNAVITDPTDIRLVFNQVDLPTNYKAPLEFLEYKRTVDWNFLKNVRNSLLAASDGRIAEDMPESIKQKWIAYRQKLRDLPEDWGNVPTYLVRFPMSPDETSDPNFDDPDAPVIRIADRTDADKEALSQLPSGVS